MSSTSIGSSAWPLSPTGFFVALGTRGGTVVLGVDVLGSENAERLLLRRTEGGFRDWADPADAATHSVGEDLVHVEIGWIQCFFWVRRFSIRGGRVVQTLAQRDTTATMRECDDILDHRVATDGETFAVWLDGRLTFPDAPFSERHPIVVLPTRELVVHDPPVITSIALRGDGVDLLLRTTGGFRIRHLDPHPTHPSDASSDQPVGQDELPSPFDLEIQVRLEGRERPFSLRVCRRLGQHGIAMCQHSPLRAAGADQVVHALTEISPRPTARPADRAALGRLLSRSVPR
jgi:hypothetical protein